MGPSLSAWSATVFSDVAGGIKKGVILAVITSDLEGMVALLQMPKPFRGTHPAERRVFLRKEVHAQLETYRVDNTLDARRNPNLTLYLRDLSLGGMSAISPLPLQQGERLSVYFPKTGTMGGWDAIGRVLRCAQSALGYRIAVEFDPLPAA